jgi:phosphinothricin acetyltransferase
MTLPYALRPATKADLPEIVAIYNEVIATSTAIFTDTPVTLENRKAWMQERVDKGYPLLVAVDGTGVLGLATFGDFRSFPGYRYAVEHTVHVRADARGRGLGKALIEALFAPALALGKHVMIGGIDAGNAASLRLHEKLGFVETGRMPEVGRKGGQWLDLVFMQKLLDAPGAARPD